MFRTTTCLCFVALIAGAFLLTQEAEAGPRSKVKSFTSGAQANGMVQTNGRRGRRAPSGFKAPVPTQSGVGLLTPAVQAAPDYVPPSPPPCPNPAAHAPGC